MRAVVLLDEGAGGSCWTKQGRYLTGRSANSRRTDMVCALYAAGEGAAAVAEHATLGCCVHVVRSMHRFDIEATRTAVNVLRNLCLPQRARSLVAKVSRSRTIAAALAVCATHGPRPQLECRDSTGGRVIFPTR